MGGLFRRNVSTYAIKDYVKPQKYSASAAGVSVWRVWKRAPPNYESEASLLEPTSSEIPINYANANSACGKYVSCTEIVRVVTHVSCYGCCSWYSLNNFLFFGPN